MTVEMISTTGQDAYGVVYPSCLRALSGHEHEIMHRFMLNSPQVWIGKDGDEVLCFMGLIPPTLLSDRAYLWMRTTDASREHVFVLVRQSQRLIARMLRDFPLIVGHCEVNNPKAVRWLRWLGATFGTPEGHLIPFEIRAKHD